VPQKNLDTHYRYNVKMSENKTIDCDIVYGLETIKGQYCWAKKEITQLQKTTKKVSTFQKYLFIVICVVLSLIPGFFVFALLNQNITDKVDGKRPSLFASLPQNFKSSNAPYAAMLSIAVIGGFGVLAAVGSYYYSEDKPWATKDEKKSLEEIELDKKRIDSLLDDKKFAVLPPLL